MYRKDFQKLIGAEKPETEYVPVACLLSSGYGAAGYYNTALNQGLEDTCVLINARLAELIDDADRTGPKVRDFNDFIQDIVTHHYNDPDGATMPQNDVYGTSIPLAAVPYDQIALVYPVAQIAALMKRAEDGDDADIPTFLDFDNKSVVLKLLRTKLW